MLDTYIAAVARWAARVGVAVVLVLLQTWTPRPCVLGLLPRGTRSAIADVSLRQWSRRTERLGIQPYRQTVPRQDAGRCPFGSSPSRSASTQSI